MEEKEINNEKLMDGSIFRPQENELQQEEIKEPSKEDNQDGADEDIKDTSEVSETMQEIDVADKLMDEVDKAAQENIQENETKEENNLQEDELPLKKYIFYVSKDFTEIIDSLSIDKRTAYINEAIQMKIDSSRTNLQNEKVRKLVFQAILVFLTVCIVTPLAVFIMNKAIMLTFENYKYSQHNFEKLYKQRFESDRAYMRSVQYNKIYQELSKKK